MVLDTRGHDIPSGNDGWGYAQDMTVFSRSINSVRTEATLVSAQSAADEMTSDDLDPIGTVWWVTAEAALYVYHGGGFARVSDDRSGTEWTELALTNDFQAYGGGVDTTPRYKVSRDGVVTLTGAITPASNAVGEEIQGTTGSRNAVLLPAAIRPTNPYALHQINQGSQDAVWLSQYDADAGQMGVARYRGSGTASAGTWLPFSITYQV